MSHLQRDLSLFDFFCESIEYNIELIDSFNYTRISIEDLDQLRSEVKAYILPLSIQQMCNNDMSFSEKTIPHFTSFFPGVISVENFEGYLSCKYRQKDKIAYFQMEKVNDQVVISDGVLNYTNSFPQMFR